MFYAVIIVPVWLCGPTVKFLTTWLIFKELGVNVMPVEAFSRITFYFPAINNSNISDTWTYETGDWLALLSLGSQKDNGNRILRNGLVRQFLLRMCNNNMAAIFTFFLGIDMMVINNEPLEILTEMYHKPVYTLRVLSFGLRFELYTKF
jgi:hypothetical protein